MAIGGMQTCPPAGHSNYSECRVGPLVPFGGAVSFDNTLHAIASVFIVCERSCFD
jgi:hypothetical protein